MTTNVGTVDRVIRGLVGLFLIAMVSVSYTHLTLPTKA
jgi:hypothetical protein